MPSEKQAQERWENAEAILKHLRCGGACSRRELCDSLSLSWGCISELASILLNKGVLLEEAGDPSGKGRTPTVLRLNPRLCFLGVDINRMGLKACVCSLSGERLYACGGMLRSDSRQAFVESVKTFVQPILEHFPDLMGIGFAMQGILDRKRTVWQFPGEPPLTIDFVQDFADCFSVPYLVEHDPDCILYGCLEQTAGQSMILRLDKGIGAAILRDGAFWKQDPLEIGYWKVNDRGELLQDVVSLQRVRELEAGADSGELRRYLEQAGGYLGVTLGNLCNLLNLHEIYLCGDLISYYSDFSETMLDRYRSTVLPGQEASIQTVCVTDAAYGAAKIAIGRFDQTVLRR